LLTEGSQFEKLYPKRDILEGVIDRQQKAKQNKIKQNGDCKRCGKSRMNRSTLDF
jgi:hypothetical protein